MVLLGGILSSTLALSVLDAPPSAALSTQASWNGNPDTNCGKWFKATPPPGQNTAILTLSGGGGGGGQANRGENPSGGDGGALQETVNGITQPIWVEVGCGGLSSPPGPTIQAEPGGAGYGAGGSSGYGADSDYNYWGSGAGGGASVVCLGSSNCATPLAVASGGGGAGGENDCTTSDSAGSGGSGNSGSGTSSIANGIAVNNGAGGYTGDDGQGGGGGQATSAGAGGGGQHSADNGSGGASTPWASSGGSGGVAGAGTWDGSSGGSGGGGGGGYNGGGGAGGDTTECDFGTGAGAAGGGGGGGSSAINLTYASSFSWSSGASGGPGTANPAYLNQLNPTNTINCPNGVGETAGGCPGYVTLTWTNDPQPQISSVNPSSGPVTGGNTITITGSNLSPANGVNFGNLYGTDGTIISQTSNQIVVRVPPEAPVDYGGGPVSIAVTTAGGSTTDPAVYQYTAQATVSWSTDPNSACGSWVDTTAPVNATSAQITMSGAGGGAGAYYVGQGTSAVGGDGSQVSAVLENVAGESLAVNLGCGGGSANQSTQQAPGGAGYAAGGSSGDEVGSDYFSGGGGGGASALCLGTSSCGTQIIVAGGGGGAGGESDCGGSLATAGSGGSAGNVPDAVNPAYYAEDGSSGGTGNDGQGGGGGGYYAGGGGGNGADGSSEAGSSGGNHPTGIGGTGGSAERDARSGGGGGGGGGWSGGGGGGGDYCNTGSAAGGGGGGGSSYTNNSYSLFGQTSFTTGASGGCNSTGCGSAQNGYLEAALWDLQAPTISSVEPGSGPVTGGTTITITGTGLAPAAFVGVGGQFGATIVSDSPTQIIAITPNGSVGDNAVEVTTDAGIAIDANGFNYLGYPSITTTSLASATVGSPYGANLVASGGLTPYSWSIASGSLPAGLSLNASTGAITGTPTSAGSSTIVFKVTDAEDLSSLTASGLPLTVAKTTTSALASFTPTSTSYGSSISYGASVTTGWGSATGSVSFSIGSTSLCSATVTPSGFASCNASTAPLGSDQSVTASYSGDANHLASQGNATGLDVARAVPAMKVLALPNATSWGLSVEYSASLSNAGSDAGGSTPTGTVVFEVGSEPLCTANVTAGVASCDADQAPTSPGELITAAYGGDAHYVSTSGTATLSVSLAEPIVSSVVSPTSTSYGSPVKYSVLVASPTIGTPTGTVTFGTSTLDLCTVTLVGGGGSCVSNQAPVGARQPIYANYSGDANFNFTGLYPTSVLTVTKAMPQISPSVKPKVVRLGAQVDYRASITSPGSTAPSGSVTFSTGSTHLCTASLSGAMASCLATNAPRGAKRIITVSYSGDPNLEPASAETALAVFDDLSRTTEVLAPSSVAAGSAVTYTATVSSGGGSPTGTVSFTIGSTKLCSSSLSAGKASCSAANAPIGTAQTVTAKYSGSTRFGPSSASNATLSVLVTPSSSGGTTRTHASKASSPAAGGGAITTSTTQAASSTTSPSGSDGGSSTPLWQWLLGSGVLAMLLGAGFFFGLSAYRRR